MQLQIVSVLCCRACNRPYSFRQLYFFFFPHPAPLTSTLGKLSFGPWLMFEPLNHVPWPPVQGCTVNRPLLQLEKDNTRWPWHWTCTEMRLPTPYTTYIQWPFRERSRRSNRAICPRDKKKKRGKRAKAGTNEIWDWPTKRQNGCDHHKDGIPLLSWYATQWFQSPF